MTAASAMLVCLLLLSAIAAAAVTAIMDQTTIPPAIAATTVTADQTTTSPDECHIIGQSYSNTNQFDPCGPWEIGYVLTNGQTIWNSSMCLNMYQGFGLTVFTMDASTCTVLKRRTYHTSELESESWALVTDLMQAKDGSWLIGVTGSDARHSLDPAIQTLNSFGVYVGGVHYQGSFIFALKKGDLSKTTVNTTLDNSEQPARLDVVISDSTTTSTTAEATTPTTAPMYVPGEVLGCFRDIYGSRDLIHEIPSEVLPDINSNKLCGNECLRRGYLYAGCQLEVMCFCGNRFGAYGVSDECTMACPGDNTTMCGGRLANTVIFTGLGLTEVSTTPDSTTADITTTAELTNCPDGFSFNSGSCYRSVTTGTSWTGAEHACSSYVNGAHPVFIDNAAENTYVLSLITNNGACWWTGGYRVENVFEWTTTWNNGTLTSKPMGSYTAWSTGQPSGDGPCMEIVQNAGWNDLSCDVSCFFLCEVDPI